MRYAVVDTGSNTIRLGVYEYKNNTLTQLKNTAIFANLAAYIEDGVLTEAGICAAKDAILSHMKTAKSFDCDAHVFATAAIRNAKNTEQIAKTLEKQTGVQIDVLTGNEEALFSFFGAASDFSCTDGVMADVGGGSSEIIAFSEKKPTALCSVPWGSLKAYNAFVSGTLPTAQEILNIKAEITNVLKANDAFLSLRHKSLCIVGGGVRASKILAKAFLDEDTLSVSVIDRMLKKITQDPSFSEETILRLTPDRAKTIAPALAIYSAVGSFFHAQNVFVSDHGIKEGYILARLIK